MRRSLLPAAALLGVVLVGLLALSIGAVAAHLRAPAGAGASRAATAEVLAALASPSPLPAPAIPFTQLRPAQQECLRGFHLDADYDAAYAAARTAPLGLRGLLNAIGPCVSRLEGRPPPTSLPYPEILATPAVPRDPYGSLPHRPAGAGTIIDNGDHADKSTVIVNRWVEGSGPDRVIVSAGAYRRLPTELSSVPAQGFVEVASGQPAARPSGIFPTPMRAGTVQIIDATGEVLTLRADDGTLFYFDVAAGKYVAGPTGPASPTNVSPTPHP